MELDGHNFPTLFLFGESKGSPALFGEVDLGLVQHSFFKVVVACVLIGQLKRVLRIRLIFQAVFHGLGWHTPVWCGILGSVILATGLGDTGL